MKAYKQRRGIIVAQAPMRNTTEDFWKMLYERECAVVVMLSDLKEKGKVLSMSVTYARNNYYFCQVATINDCRIYHFSGNLLPVLANGEGQYEN